MKSFILWGLLASSSFLFISPTFASDNQSPRYYNQLTITIDSRHDDKEKEDHFVFKDLSKIDGYDFKFLSDHPTYGCPAISHNLRLRPIHWGDVFISFEATHFYTLSNEKPSHQASPKTECRLSTTSSQKNIRAIADFPSTERFDSFMLSFEMGLENIL